MGSSDNPAWLPDEETGSGVQGGTAQGDSRQDPIMGEPLEYYDTDVLGVPLMDGEKVYWVGHPSRWTIASTAAVTAVAYLFILLGLLQYYLGIFNAIGPIATLTEDMSMVAGSFAGVAIPWYIWPILFIGGLTPLGLKEANRRWRHYVVTNYRVMDIKSFPSKEKDWTEITDIKSFTSMASLIERRLGIGTVKFLPANEDNVVFRKVYHYEYWESKVKELQRKMEREGASAGMPDSAVGSPREVTGPDAGRESDHRGFGAENDSQLDDRFPGSSDGSDSGYHWDERDGGF